MVRVLGRGGAVAVAAQVGGDDVEALGERGGKLVPGDVGQRVAVQKQKRRAAAAVAQADAGAGCFDIR